MIHLNVTLNVFNMITQTYELKTSKNIFHNCICKFDGKKCNANPKSSNNKCRYECKYSVKHSVCIEFYVWNPSAYN